jgi:3-hydroxyisobutyrate dehydrogenase-like beta-hydroxyacid dehydrogenase
MNYKQVEHMAHGCNFVAAPVFARPDGVAAKQCSFVVSGQKDAVDRAMPILEATAVNVFRFGEDAGTY